LKAHKHLVTETHISTKCKMSSISKTYNASLKMYITLASQDIKHSSWTKAVW